MLQNHCKDSLFPRFWGDGGCGRAIYLRLLLRLCGESMFHDLLGRLCGILQKQPQAKRRRSAAYERNTRLSERNTG